MKTIRDFNGSIERYHFDFGQCSSSEQFAQLDTSQDARYFGMWGNPFTMTVVTYCEGDITYEECESAGEFSALIEKLASFYDGFAIDPGFDHENNPVAIEFCKLGLGDYIH